MASQSRDPTPRKDYGPRLSSAALRAALRPGHERCASNIPAGEFEGIVAGAFPFLRALPDPAGKALQRHQRRAGISPFLQLFDGVVIERLAAGAARKQRAGDVDHVRRAGALVSDGRAAAGAET